MSGEVQLTNFEHALTLVFLGVHRKRTSELLQLAKDRHVEIENCYRACSSNFSGLDSDRNRTVKPKKSEAPMLWAAPTIGLRKPIRCTMVVGVSSEGCAPA